LLDLITDITGGRARIERGIPSKQCLRAKGTEGIRLCGFDILRTVVIKNAML
jgi:hypothetical protein